MGRLNDQRITTPDLIRIDNQRKKLVDGNIIWVPDPKVKAIWPEHIRRLAANAGEAWFALHDALLELGLEKSAAHFVENHCVPWDKLSSHEYCSFAIIIAKNGNPDWGNMFWCLGDELITYLEIQQELEDWWNSYI